jgi:hypothetical protein
MNYKGKIDPVTNCNVLSITDTLFYSTDQIIDVAMARSLHADAAVARAVFWDLSAYPERYAARLATSGAQASPYILLGRKARPRKSAR